MPNRLVLFPAAKETEARAYAAWTNQNWPGANDPEDPGAIFAYVRPDLLNQLVVPYLGPPFEWDGVELPEPEAGPAMRADGVLVDQVTWPAEEE